jgi:membrane fusion protein, heavy metal efflux system
MRFSFAAISAVALIATLGLSPALAHEGHDHEPQTTPVSGNIAARGEAASDAFELVAVASGAGLLIYLDRFATNEPVDGATIEVETPQGPVKATPHAGNAYRLDATWLAKPGRFDLIFTVTADGTADVLPLTLDLSSRAATTEPAASSPARQSWSDRAKTLVQPAVLAAAALGFLLGGVLMALTRRRRPGAVARILVCACALGSGKSVAHEGHQNGDPNPLPLATGNELAQRLPDGAIFVPKPIQRIFGLRTALIETGTYRRSVELPGKIIPDPNASGYVQAAVGGRLTSPPGGFPRLGTLVQQGDVLAYVTPPYQPIDVSDMRQRQGELDQQISIVERRLARYEQLAPGGAVARSQLEDTRLELLGLRERRASLDKVRREPEALVAPVSGVIADGTPVAGQIAQTNAIIFHIVDPARLWVEALSFEAIAGSEDASALTSNGRTLSLTHRGSGFADRSQSIPIHFAVEGDAGGLRAGQFVTVLVAASERKRGIAIPRASLVRGANGQDIVFEHVTAERFVPRAVRVEPLDAERVLIAAGLPPGKRIVVQGAELLDHVR